ncbi:UNVERIFIED_CONTAM: hypothetical protein RMT77_009617 [Armadillidium vulgare]
MHCQFCNSCSAICLSLFMLNDLISFPVSKSHLKRLFHIQVHSPTFNSNELVFHTFKLILVPKYLCKSVLGTFNISNSFQKLSGIKKRKLFALTPINNHYKIIKWVQFSIDLKISIHQQWTQSLLAPT